MVRLIVCLVALVAVGVFLESSGVVTDSDRTTRHAPVHPGEEPPCTNFYLC